VVEKSSNEILARWVPLESTFTLIVEDLHPEPGGGSPLQR
jgi:hypothetical protein